MFFVLSSTKSLSRRSTTFPSLRGVKVDGSGRREVQLPSTVYRLLMAVIQQTEEIRENAPESIVDYLFIYESNIKKIIRRLTGETFRRLLSNLGKELGIEGVSTRTIRRRYETEVVLQGVQRNLNRLAISPLTGHASLSTTERYYIRDDIRDYLEATYGIEIGVPALQGEIVSDGADTVTKEINQNEDLVENGAGYCRNAECNIPGTMTCLMCKGFVTTPRCLPEMEEALSNVHLRLAENATNTHDREHLLAVKRLVLGYIAVMLSMKEDDQNE